MEFEPEYFSGILKVLILTLLISILPIYFMANPILIIGISIFAFIAILSINKKWIKKVILDSKREKIIVKYPLSIIGLKKTEIPFDKIDIVTYYEYMSRTPAHFKIEQNGKKLRFNCNGLDSKKVSSILENCGIKTNFYNRKEVGFR
ncbi:hypothetical protein [Confluentibacter sediminis]|uniref:hypothetical protein n=1 Tax=Confluentibacter sediminis TaxID=2219045 RepID=UPI000DAC58A1|nr:hypothetical protein [Confluentibacter sediminis]